MKIEYTANADVRATISRLGRTEDVQFSPEGGRLAVAAFNDNRLLILRVEAHWESRTADNSPAQFPRGEFDALQNPHGFCWIDERTIVVANRTAQLIIFELPEEPISGRARLSPVKTLGDDVNDLIKTPGSVSAVTVGADLIEIIVCNNYVHHVSRHLLDRRSNFGPIASEILIHDGLTIPDGVAHSPSGRWIAVSNHGHHNVLLFRNDGDLGPSSQPQATLSGMNHPHGVRFADDGRSILVADAGAPVDL